MEINNELTRLENYKYKNNLFCAQEKFFYKQIKDIYEEEIYKKFKEISSNKNYKGQVRGITKEKEKLKNLTEKSISRKNENYKKIYNKNNIYPRYHFINQNQKLIPESVFVETLEFQYKHDDDEKYGYNFYLLNENTKQNEFIYRNLRFENEEDINKIEYIELQIAGTRHDRIYMDFYHNLQKLYEMNTIPLYYFKFGLISLLYHDIQLQIKFKNESDNYVKILVDKYKNCNRTDKSYEFMIYQNQAVYFYDDKKKLNLNHPCYLLIANKKLKNIKLKLQKDKESELEEFKLEQDNNNIIYLTNNKDLNHFSRSFNFSRIDYSYLHYECDDEEGLRITAINSHVSRSMSGMCGLAFSK